MIWVYYIFCAVLIFFCGSKLSYYGDIIAEKSGLGRTLIGSTLVASVTSLPELITSISAVYFHDLPDFSLANILGASCYNLLLFALLDIMVKPYPLASYIRKSHIVSCAFGLIFANLISFGLIFPRFNETILHVGVNTLLITIFYFIALRILLREEAKNAQNDPNISDNYRDITLSRSVFYYTINSVIVVIAAYHLPLIGEEMANLTGLGKTLIGNVFISISTSLPEIVVSYTSIKRGFFDLAAGNIFGSILFNILILSIADLLYFKGAILSFVNSNHLLSVFSLSLMLCITILNISLHKHPKRNIFSIGSIFMILIFFLNWFLLYRLR